jgi:hypothetical protein
LTTALKVWRLKEVDNLTFYGLNVDSTSDSSRRSRKGSAEHGEDNLSTHHSLDGQDELLRIDGGLLESYTKIWETIPAASNIPTPITMSKTPNLKYSSPFCNISKYL